MPRNNSSRFKVCFISTSNAGVAFYRMWQFRQSMKDQGLAETVIPWFNFDEIHAQIWQWHVHDDFQVFHHKGVIASLCKDADVVVVQYLHTMEALALIEALKACLPNTPFLTEIDDNIFDTPPSNAAFDAYRPGEKYREVVLEQLKALDGVICSTPHLATACREFNEHVYIVPNCLDFGIWDKVQPFHAKTEFRIGWAGAGNHDEDLRTIEGPLKKFLAEHKNVSFHIVHGVPDFFKDQSKVVTHKWWRPINRYPKHLGKMGFDVGIAPLLPSAFNLSKSNLRMLEYAGLGIPCIARNTGEFARTMKHGLNGFLYNTPEEFYGYLETLYSDRELCSKMGKYNNLYARKEFNVKNISRDYLNILKEVYERGQVTTIDVSPGAGRGAKWIDQRPNPIPA